MFEEVETYQTYSYGFDCIREDDDAEMKLSSEPNCDEYGEFASRKHTSQNKSDLKDKAKLCDDHLFGLSPFEGGNSPVVGHSTNDTIESSPSGDVVPENQQNDCGIQNEIEVQQVACLDIIDSKLLEENPLYQQYEEEPIDDWFCNHKAGPSPQDRNRIAALDNWQELISKVTGSNSTTKTVEEEEVSQEEVPVMAKKVICKEKKKCVVTEDKKIENRSWNTKTLHKNHARSINNYILHELHRSTLTQICSKVLTSKGIHYSPVETTQFIDSLLLFVGDMHNKLVNFGLGQAKRIWAGADLTVKDNEVSGHYTKTALSLFGECYQKVVKIYFKRLGVCKSYRGSTSQVATEMIGAIQTIHSSLDCTAKWIGTKILISTQ